MAKTVNGHFSLNANTTPRLDDSQEQGVFNNINLKQCLSEIFMRFQEETHEEIVSLFDEQIILSVEVVPEYLQHGNESKSIIVQKFLQNKVKQQNLDHSEFLKSTSTPVKSLSSQSSYEQQSELDITGSPLKCPFSLDDEGNKFSPCSFGSSRLKKIENKQNPSYAGLSVAKARNIASELLSALRSEAKEKVFLRPIWIACDGGDPKKTKFIGVHNEESRFTLSDITCSGPCEGTKALPTIDHLTSYFSYGCPVRRIDTAVNAVYEVLSSDDADGSTIYLHSSWKHPLSTLSPPTIDANTFTKVHIDPSDPRSDAYQVYLELNFLESLIGGLETGEVTWFLQADATPVLQLLDEYFSDQKEKKTNDNYMTSFDNVIERKFLQVRPNLGFTDILWSLLMKCQSYNELQQCLLHAFNAISSGIIRPQVHIKNKTQVAEICRKLMRGQEQVPELKGLLPLEMMVEIGLEKIKRDYISIFEVGDLVKVEQLLQFIDWTSANDPFKDCLKKLQHIHVALQVVIALRRYLRLPTPVLVHCTSQILAELNEKDELQLDFNFNFQTSLIHTLFNSLSPILWKLNIYCNSEGGSNYSKSSDYYIKRDSDFFAPSLNSEAENDATLDGSDVLKYFCLAVTKISNKF